MDNEIKKQEIAEKIGSMDIQAELIDLDRENLKKNYNAIPISDILSLGMTFRNAVSIIKTTASTSSKLLRINLPFNLKSLGINASFEIGSGFAAINPYLILVAGTLICINRKLDRIEKTQRDILNFLEIKEKSDLTANYKTLCNINNAYKLNWHNEQFKNTNHNQVGNIKSDTLSKIEFYSTQMDNLFGNNLLYTSPQAKKEINKAYDYFRSYQLAVYVYVFSVYLDMLFVENYESENLNMIQAFINKYIEDYYNTYDNLYGRMENYLDKTVEAFAIKFGKTVGEVTVDTAKKAAEAAKEGFEMAKGLFGSLFGPSNTQKAEQPKEDNIAFDEESKEITVENSEEKAIEKVEDEKEKKEPFTEHDRNSALAKFSRRKELDVSVFLENIKTIDTYYNNSQVILMDEKNIYLPVNAEQ